MNFETEEFWKIQEKTKTVHKSNIRPAEVTKANPGTETHIFPASTHTKASKAHQVNSDATFS